MLFEPNILSYILLTAVFMGVAALLVIRTGNRPDVPPRFLESQGDFASESQKGESPIIRSSAHPEGPPEITVMNQTVKTLSDLYQLTLRKYKQQRFLGSSSTLKEADSGILWYTYEDAYKRLQSLYSGIVHRASLEPCTGRESSFVGIYASTSPDAYMVQIACHWGGLVTVPIAAQATPLHIIHVIRNTLLTTLVIHETHLEYVLRLVEGTSVKHIIVIDEEKEEVNNATDYSGKGSHFGLTITSLCKIQEIGKAHTVERCHKITTESIASIYYDSKTQNQIKGDGDQQDRSLGVILSHKNVIAAIASNISHTATAHKITTKDRLMHSFAIDNVLGYVLQAAFCYVGGSIAFENKVLPNEFNLDVSSVLSTVKRFHPTVYGSGGPFLRQVQKLIAGKYGNSFLFQRGLDRKDRYHKEGRLVADCIYDMLVFRDIRQSVFGGSIRLVYIDNDDLPKSDLGCFYRAILGAQVLKTFSRAETSSSIMSTMVYDYALDKRAVGPPVASVQAKLCDIDTEEYNMVNDSPRNPRGEIKVRGDTIFEGYWNDTLATASNIDRDGWYSTGIVGELLPNGCFLVISVKQTSPTNS